MSRTMRQAARRSARSAAEPDGQRVIALAGNPNVGKSTIFNSLTGLRQHTGNWPGKTVGSAAGRCRGGGRDYVLVDTPGTYSLRARSAEEEAARDYICFGAAQAVAVVCDATCLERNLNLLLQIMETGRRTLLIVNLMDEAAAKGVSIDLAGLRELLGVPVIGTVARDRRSREKLLAALELLFSSEGSCSSRPVPYPEAIELAAERLAAYLPDTGALDRRWLCLRLLEGETGLIERADEFLGGALLDSAPLMEQAELERAGLLAGGVSVGDTLASCTVRLSELICADFVKAERRSYSDRDRRIDKLVTGRLLGYPLMLLLLALVFYITIVGANYPSQWLASGLFQIESLLSSWLETLGVPDPVRGLLVDGAWRGLAQVVSVMLPPMAIFFPLFTLLEDLGYLPRIAYNLDRPFRRCGSCGKQALTMAMGFGCNAAGVAGCRIIDSPRERRLAVLTNSFVPCNGRFPTMILLIGLFFAGSGGLMSAALLSLVILLGVAVTFAATALLSKTILKGESSSFVLELPPYRRPEPGRILLRSLLDKTLCVLGRAAAVAAPAGALLWCLANVSLGETTLLRALAFTLDGAGRAIGLDGAILLAFILGFPANEIVLPIAAMVYSGCGSLAAAGDAAALGSVLLNNGWTGTTAVCYMLFSLMHWPCSTTILTIKKETGSGLMALLAAVIPTIAGFICCFAVNHLAKMI